MITIPWTEFGTFEFETDALNEVYQDLKKNKGEEKWKLINYLRSFIFPDISNLDNDENNTLTYTATRKTIENVYRHIIKEHNRRKELLLEHERYTTKTYKRDVDRGKKELEAWKTLGGPTKSQEVNNAIEQWVKLKDFLEKYEKFIERANQINKKLGLPRIKTEKLEEQKIGNPQRIERIQQSLF